MGFRTFIKEGFTEGEKVTFQNKDWEVLEVKGRYLKLVDSEGKEITTVESDKIKKKIEEVIDPDYKPGGRYYRDPGAEDKKTGAKVRKERTGTGTLFHIFGTKEQVDKQIDKIEKEYPASGYGTTVKRISEEEATVRTHSAG